MGPWQIPRVSRIPTSASGCEPADDPDEHQRQLPEKHRGRVHRGDGTDRLNVPLISLWVQLLAIPYRFLYPSALFFVCVGVFSARNSMFDVSEALVLGLFGFLLPRPRFHPAPILLGFVLGPRMQENFRNALAISHGSLGIVVQRPLTLAFLLMSLVLLSVQLYTRSRVRRVRPSTVPLTTGDP